MTDYSNLPKEGLNSNTGKSSSDATIRYFDAYGKAPLEFNASESDTVISFLQNVVWKNKRQKLLH